MTEVAEEEIQKVVQQNIILRTELNRALRIIASSPYSPSSSTANTLFQTDTSVYNIKKIKECSQEFPYELKMIINHARDRIDWALIMYLFRNSSHTGGHLYKEQNVITIGKISNYFGLDYNNTYDRLTRMNVWCSINIVYKYIKPVFICSITEIGVDTIFVLMKLIDAR